MKTIKKICLSTIIAVLLLLCTKGNQQTTYSRISKIKLTEAGAGSVELHDGPDNFVYWNFGPFGKIFPLNAYHSNKNQRNIYISIM